MSLVINQLNPTNRDHEATEKPLKHFDRDNVQLLFTLNYIFGFMPQIDSLAS